MPDPVTIFISYSHKDACYLEKGSLLGFLKGLEEEGIQFWTDHRIATGELWDDEIKAKIAQSHIALVLVSQAFLDSHYCKDVEISSFLAKNILLFPVILSACEWERHEWLKSRQFLPLGEKTIERHYRDKGRRKEIFLEIRKQLREHVEKLRRSGKTAQAPSARPYHNPFTQTLAIRDAARFIGRQAEMGRLQALLRGGSVALLGEPKIGKSSLLFRLACSWDEGEVMGPFDFQEIEDREDFYAALAERLGTGDTHWRSLRAVLKKRTVLLLLDELDAAPARGLTHEDLARLRSVCQSSPGFKMVTASRNPLKQLYPDQGKDSPGYNVLQPFTLGPTMTEAEIRILLDHPWDPKVPCFDPAIVDHLLEVLKVAARHPFKLQRAGFHHYEALMDPSHDWKAAWRQDLEQML